MTKQATTDFLAPEIIVHPAFKTWTVRLRAALSPQFAAIHPEINVQGRLDDLAKVVVRGHRTDQIVERITALIAPLAETDKVFCYTREEYEWLLAELTSDHRQLTMSLLLAVILVKDELLTPVEAAERSIWAASTWRNRCAEGVVFGAQKRGKQWLIPMYMIALMGLTNSVPEC